MSFIKLVLGIALGVVVGKWLYSRFFVPKVNRPMIDGNGNSIKK